VLERLPGPALLPVTLRRPAAGVVALCLTVTAVIAVSVFHQSRAGWLDATVDARIKAGLGGHPLSFDLGGHSLLTVVSGFGDLVPVTMMTVALAVACLVTRRWRAAVLAGVAVLVSGVRHRSGPQAPHRAALEWLAQLPQRACHPHVHAGSHLRGAAGRPFPPAGARSPAAISGAGRGAGSGRRLRRYGGPGGSTTSPMSLAAQPSASQRCCWPHSCWTGSSRLPIAATPARPTGQARWHDEIGKLRVRHRSLTRRANLACLGPGPIAAPCPP